jgi:hypothetical protein
VTTLTLTASAPCSGGEHFRLNVTGDFTRQFNLSVSDVIGPITDDQVQDAMLVLLRLYAKGKTRTQVRTGLAAGVVVTL